MAAVDKSNKRWFVVAGIGVAVLVVGAWLIGGYNGLVRSNEAVDGKWSQVEADLQRRADLIPNLVSTVKGYASHEEAIFTEVSEARSRLVGAVEPEQASQANGELSAALGRLIAIAEAYPDLKANTNFIQLQDELAGTENRVAVSRKDYNDQVRSFNQQVKVFPTNILAGWFGFGERDYFEAEAGSETVPVVTFE
jgi:LemA protein